MNNPQAIGQERGRIVALDFTKGALVLFMILYHWLNYFVSPTGMFYNYLRFITPSFIFISGFLVTNVGFAKHRNDAGRFRSRLLQRGFRLLILFTVINIASGLLLPGGDMSSRVGMVRGVGAFFENANDIYITGNGKGAAFQILVPISYVLIMAGILTLAGRRFKTALFAFAGALALAMCVMSVLGRPSGQLYSLGSGVLGLCLGTIPLRSIEQLLARPIFLAVAYCGYLALITMSTVSYMVQIAGTLLTLLVIYALGKAWENESRVYRLVVTLGQYSLFAYIAQIALLQLLRAVFLRLDLGSGSLQVSFLASFGLSVFAVGAIDFIRSRNKLTDRIYRFLFA